MNTEEMRAVISQITFPDYTFFVRESCGQPYLQAEFNARDVVSGEIVTQATRKWRLSHHMVKNEIVQTVFKCVMTAVEHEVRENFTYRDQRIYGPHFDVDALHDLCLSKKLDYRK